MSKRIRQQFRDSGIYQIINTKNNKVYIGSSCNMYTRYKQHKTGLINNKHENSYLQRSFNKYGRESFKFSILERGIKNEDLLKMERYWIIKKDSINRNKGYNLCIPQDGDVKFKFSEESISKLTRISIEYHHGKMSDDDYKLFMDKRACEKTLKLETKKKFKDKYGIDYCYNSNVKEVVVICYKTNKLLGRFGSIADAAKYMKTTYEKASSVLHNRKSSYGTQVYHYKSMVVVLAKDYDINKDYTINPFRRVWVNSKNPLVQCIAIDYKTNKFIGEYSSQKEASDKLNIGRSDIQGILDKKVRHTGDTMYQTKGIVMVLKDDYNVNTDYTINPYNRRNKKIIP